MATPPSMPPRDSADKSVGELVFEVSEKTSTLVREEIELAKAEIREKIASLVRGSVVGLVAGVFAFLALILIMEGVAWLLNDLFFSGNIWAGFFVEAAVFLLLAAAGGLFAYRADAVRRTAGARAGDRGGEADARDAGIRVTSGERGSERGSISDSSRARREQVLP